MDRNLKILIFWAFGAASFWIAVFLLYLIIRRALLLWEYGGDFTAFLMVLPIAAFPTVICGLGPFVAWGLFKKGLPDE